MWPLCNKTSCSKVTNCITLFICTQSHSHRRTLNPCCCFSDLLEIWQGLSLQETFLCLECFSELQVTLVLVRNTLLQFFEILNNALKIRHVHWLYFAPSVLLVWGAGMGGPAYSWGGKVPWGCETGKSSLLRKDCGFFKYFSCWGVICGYLLPWAFHFHSCLSAFWYWALGFCLNYLALHAAFPEVMALFAMCWPVTALNMDV